MLTLVLAAAIAVTSPPFVESFSVLGPVTATPFDRALERNPFATELADEGALSPALAPAGLTWRSATAIDGRVDLGALFGDHNDAVAYAHTWIGSPADLDLTLLAGSDDGIAVWLDGRRVHAHNIARPLGIDDDAIPIRLRRGWNRLLVKVSQQRSKWEFALRLSTRYGEPVDLPVRASKPTASDDIVLPAMPLDERHVRFDAILQPVARRVGGYRAVGTRSPHAAAGAPEIEVLRAIDDTLSALVSATSEAAVLAARASLNEALLAAYRGAAFGDDTLARDALIAVVENLRDTSPMFPFEPTQSRDDTWLRLDALHALVERCDTLAALAVSAVIERSSLTRADHAIEAHRKSDASLRIVDAGGAPLANAVVTVEQISSDFRFGSNIYLFRRASSEPLNAAYEQRFATLFNYATTDFYWEWYERVRGKPDYPYTDAVVDWCAKHDIRLKGHPILWQRATGLPTWGIPTAEEERQRVVDLVGRYRGRIQSWDVVNESLHMPHPVDEPHRVARETAPEAELVVNEFAILNDGFPPFYAMLERMLADSVPFDAIGLQAHEPLHARFPLDAVECWLDRYATLGKPIHITELATCSGGQPIRESHLEGTWNEALQADYVAKLYRVLFAHPTVEAITWWDLSDRKAWQKGGGLVRSDMSPKPAYEALRELILERWRTRFEARTDATGMIRFRGFHGNYTVTVADQRFTIRVRKGGLNAYPLRLPPTTAR